MPGRRLAAAALATTLAAAAVAAATPAAAALAAAAVAAAAESTGLQKLRISLWRWSRMLRWIGMLHVSHRQFNLPDRRLTAAALATAVATSPLATRGLRGSHRIMHQ